MENDNKDNIYVVGAREKNLKNISVSISKKKITVFTGVSGSGKSSLVFDTIAAESQRQLNETYTSFIRHRLPQYGQPDVDSIQNLPVAFVISQKRLGGNSRSTVGTITDIYSLLRLLYSRIGSPFVGYSEAFSFNNTNGMCPNCSGIGKVETINIERLLDKSKSLNQGAILFPTFEPGGWRLKRYIYSGFFDNDKKIRDYSTEELELLLHKTNIKVQNPEPEWPKTSLYEALIPRIERSFLKNEGREKTRHSKKLNYLVTKAICPICNGARLNKQILSCKINDKNIADCTSMQIDNLITFIKAIKNKTVTTVLGALLQQLKQMEAIGLSYLTLNRETTTLSGGESQRIKMLRQLASSLSDVTYIFDEPSIGLHPYNIAKINNLLKLLCDKGNTVLIVEHDPDIMKIADSIIDMGPKAGIHGGEVVFQGSYEKLKTANTLTAKYLKHKISFKNQLRQPQDFLTIEKANRNNLQNITINIPKCILTVVTGVAGSGKSTLINQVLPDIYPNCTIIDQKSITASKRSNIATITNIFDDIRNLFAKENNVDSSLFSFNSKGACPTCKGLGITYTDLAFMDTVATVCDSCEGKRYTNEVLKYKLHQKNINDILNLTIEETTTFFKKENFFKILSNLNEVGLGYISLGQSLNTLSGGELQRVKLATELGKKNNIYILDEPTTGLHMSDIQQLLQVLNRIVDQNNTMIIIEHNLDVIAQADWLIDLGPGAGQAGGKILFEGHPKDLINSTLSITGKYLKEYMVKG